MQKEAARLDPSAINWRVSEALSVLTSFQLNVTASEDSAQESIKEKYEFQMVLAVLLSSGIRLPKGVPFKCDCVLNYDQVWVIKGL